MADSRQTKRCIQDALVWLMLEQDVDKISAVDLARAANVSRATLYRYYGSVGDVLDELEREQLEGMRDSSRYYISSPLDTADLDKPYPPVVAIATYVRENRDFFLAVTGPHGDGRFVSQWHRLIQEFYSGKLAFERLTREGSDFYVEFVLAGSDAVLRYWLEQRPDVSPEEVAPIVQHILYGPFVG